VSAGLASGRAAWGFHRLTDRWAEGIVAEAGLGPGELVLDIGAGTGALTAPLVAAGAQVIAIELHPDRLAELRRRFGSSVRVVRADAARLRLPRRPFRVVANPPFSLTGPLLRRLLQPGSPLVAADVASSGLPPGVGWPATSPAERGGGRTSISGSARVCLAEPSAPHRRLMPSS
jgi:23S rRNA (adenine-N6)-dimethyltransferase